MLVWKDNVFGNIKWYYSTGTIHLFIKPPRTWNRVKTFLCRAFYETGVIFSAKLLDPFIEGFKPYSAHVAFPVGKKMPRFKITNFQESHGIVIRCDKSHPYSLEVEFRFPSWAEDMQLLQRQNIQSIEAFSQFMKELATPKTLREGNNGMVI